ncbi:hypothetical protein BKA66DRAFT_555043 [Pyrenochaeta sp. MPI-SDFR-AT-0127]|nr:hypothetical protein BKA66DRAFT_555043 [Pyrenochaeta sp. MPI-SDFR-AT-0127]
MKPVDLPAGLDCRGIFEGIARGSESNLPANLCLSQHQTSAKQRAAQTTFDIDSLCCFPSSLGVARLGINWLPRSHSFLNLAADIHFSLSVSAYDKRNEVTQRNVPLHKIPHYCFGSVVGLESLFIYIFFPSLRLESQYRHSNFLGTQDQELWYDAVLIPTLTEVIGSSNVLQHLPVSAHVVKLDALALSTESFARKESAREQLLRYVLQPQHLDLLWSRIRERVADNPGFERFSDATLFMHAKNTKLEYMGSSLPSAYTRWQRCWEQATDEQFYSKDRTNEAEVYLWRRCCLKAYADKRVVLLADRKHARGSPRVTTYQWAMTRDSTGQTLFAVPHGQENMDGLVYSQFYALIKTPFDTSKTRAHANLVDNRWKSYGIREEHRISMSMIDQINELWCQWDLYDDTIDDAHTLAHTARTYSLPETIVMVAALRALRFCYSSSMMRRESLLYKDRWEQNRGVHVVVREGLGMQETIERCGLGWFLPKFNWTTRRIAPPHGDNMLIGTLLMHDEYKRRWRAVKDLRDVFVRFNQAEGWYGRYNMSENRRLCQAWLEYLHVLNIEQFDADVWSAMCAADKRHKELSPKASEQDGKIKFCYKGMRDLFLVNGVIQPPHLVTGNKMQFEQAAKLLDFLFRWNDGNKRQGWENKPYRLILRRSFELIERKLGRRKVKQWWSEFLFLVQVTHWILPYPSSSALIAHTKQSYRQNLRRRMMWFSAVYAHPDYVDLPFKTNPMTLYRAIWRAYRRIGGDGDYWIAGRTSIGTKGFVGVWERSLVPSLRMREEISDKGLDELDEFIAELVVEYSVAGEREERQRFATASMAGGSFRHSLSIRDIFLQYSSGSGSVYQPSSYI